MGIYLGTYFSLQNLLYTKTPVDYGSAPGGTGLFWIAIKKTQKPSRKGIRINIPEKVAASYEILCPF